MASVVGGSVGKLFCSVSAERVKGTVSSGSAAGKDISSLLKRLTNPDVEGVEVCPKSGLI